ncbi:unnamed protein product [Musa acuminata subsp. malaccensis]|uniref:(wild Malaysian banana) hypothetical protein n=1 Tax=Musa acuminata subsp. malaccensis TaxID=214687 RepID=A0A804IBK8_MUSAM|nr:unnamed protein product [Musa acuminata subsp. malaccensis]
MSFLEMISWQSVHKQACSLQKDTERKNDRPYCKHLCFSLVAALKLLYDAKEGHSQKPKTRKHGRASFNCS